MSSTAVASTCTRVARFLNGAVRTHPLSQRTGLLHVVGAAVVLVLDYFCSYEIPKLPCCGQRCTFFLFEVLFLRSFTLILSILKVQLNE